MFYLSHPNIFDFVEELKSIQTNNYLKVLASLTELPLERQEKVSHENENLPGFNLKLVIFYARMLNKNK
jgi:hypothetical protein